MTAISDAICTYTLNTQFRYVYISAIQEYVRNKHACVRIPDGSVDVWRSSIEVLHRLLTCRFLNCERDSLWSI